MKMTPLKLMVLRCYSMTLGRLDFFAGALKDILVKKMVLNAKQSYVATSRFFDPIELED